MDPKKKILIAISRPYTWLLAGILSLALVKLLVIYMIPSYSLQSVQSIEAIFSAHESVVNAYSILTIPVPLIAGVLGYIGYKQTAAYTLFYYIMLFFAVPALIALGIVEPLPNSGIIYQISLAIIRYSMLAGVFFCYFTLVGYYYKERKFRKKK